ncbi:MAG: thermonuclease family protein [Fusobacteriaceae bacterium]|nr:thermonuclease family protein [Fusobacteriaceae bacterium]MBN2839144.1 thermonuclease family protein [Fusobacteriaceae bacterium]
MENFQEFLSNLILNKTVSLEYTSKDKYGRYLGDIYLNKLWINTKMVDNGLACNYPQYSKDLDLIKLETQARRIGL